MVVAAEEQDRMKNCFLSQCYDKIIIVWQDIVKSAFYKPRLMIAYCDQLKQIALHIMVRL